METSKKSDVSALKNKPINFALPLSCIIFAPGIKFYEKR
jgi:hypothetical protein